jgi:hypothetical protein
VENQLARLAPPSWPEDVFGKIDREKAKSGKALFVEYCGGCHNAWPYQWTEPNKYGKRLVLVGLVPQSYVGTDHTQAEAVRPFAITGQLSNYLPPELRGKDAVPMQAFGSSIQRAVIERAVAKLKLTPAELLSGAATTASTRSGFIRRRRATACGLLRHSCTTDQYPTCTRCWFRPANVRKSSASDVSLIRSKSVWIQPAGPAPSPWIRACLETRTQVIRFRMGRAAMASLDRS